MKVNLVLTEDAGVGDWVLVHAGFAIERLTEQEARETFDLLKDCGYAEA
jgi:hydrogenase expression/formation protein HypC